MFKTVLNPRGVTDVKEVVKHWSTLFLQRQFRVLKSSPHIYEVCCVQSNYPFQVHTFKGKWKDYWEVSRLVEHTCLLQQLDPHHCNLTAAFVSNYMYPHIIDNPSFEPKSIIFIVEEKFKYKISYNKAYRAKQKALEMRWGTYNARKSSFSTGREPRFVPVSQLVAHLVPAGLTGTKLKV